MKKNGSWDKNKAQALIELAVFGAVIIFLLGAIIQQGVAASFYQNNNLLMMRTALLRSHIASEQGRVDRASAAVIGVEDRLAPSSGRHGATERQMLIQSGGGTFSTMLNYTVDFGESDQLPVVDLYVNGQQFSLATSAFVTYTITRDPSQSGADSVSICYSGGCVENRKARARLAREWDYAAGNGLPPFYAREPSNAEKFKKELGMRFDLQRDGSLDGDPNTEAEISRMPWQWVWTDFAGLKAEIKQDDGGFPPYDIDGDLVEEVVYSITKNDANSYTVQVADPNAGDTVTGASVENYDSPDDVPGLKSASEIVTWMRDGTALKIEEGRLYSNDQEHNYSKSTNQKNQFDVITRVYQLNKYMIGTGTMLNTSKNPGVETSCSGVGCCSSGTNWSQTCFDITNKTLYIRSRLKDSRGSKWITQMKNDAD